MIQDKIYDALKESAFLYLDDFMNISLRDEEHGYYTSNKAIGKDGDFVTAPEISQMFGEIIAVKILNLIHARNIKKFNLIELGPGRGALINDITRVLNALLDEDVEYTIHFNEINKFYIQNLKNTYPNCKIHKNFNSYPNEFSIIIANEFFDALPVKQYKKLGRVWYERYVVKNKDKYEFKDEKIQFLEIEKNLGEKVRGYEKFIEFSPRSIEKISEISKIIKKNNGGALIIDYGYLGKKMLDTVQSVKNHKKTDILQNIYKSDITHLLNFSFYKKKFHKKLDQIKIISQRKFLINMGILHRAEILSKNLTFRQKTDLYYRVQRLIDSKQMGELFKVMFVTNKQNNFSMGF